MRRQLSSPRESASLTIVSLVQDELRKLVAPLKRDITKLWQELYITPDSADELDNFVVGRQPCASIEKLRTFDVVSRLQHKKSDLEEERDRRRKALDKAMDHIHELWTMLKINEDDEDRRQFIARKDALPAYSAPQIAVVRSGPLRHLQSFPPSLSLSLSALTRSSFFWPKTVQRGTDAVGEDQRIQDQGNDRGREEQAEGPVEAAAHERSTDPRLPRLAGQHWRRYASCTANLTLNRMAVRWGS